MFHVGKTVNVRREFKKFGLNFLGLSEIRWNGFGELSSTTGGYILYTGSKKDDQRGVWPWRKKHECNC